MDHHFIFNPPLLLLLLLNLLLITFSSCGQIASLISSAQPTVVASSRITVVGVVYCDMCSSNKFSRHSYFLPGVDVNIKCKFKGSSPKISEQMSVSVNRTTGKYGVYKVEIPNVDGVDCVEGLAIESVCTASLIIPAAAVASACNVPALKTSTNEISVKSKQDNLCIYSLAALTYRPPNRNHTLCAQTSNSNSFLNFPNNWPSSSLPFPFTFPPDWPPTKQP